jgi:hypothetical protein
VDLSRREVREALLAEHGDDPRPLVASDAPGMGSHAPTSPVGQVRGVDPLPAEEQADLAGAGAGVGGVQDPELLAVAEAAAWVRAA